MRWLGIVVSTLAVSASDSFLFRGESSAVKSLSKDDVEIVIAHYNEDLDWVVPYKHLVSIYTKGPVPFEESISLPNVGRESHTYLTHVVRNYDKLAKRTVFTQATAPSHGYKGHRAGGGHLTSGSVFEDYMVANEPVFAFFTERMHIDTLKHQMRGGYRHELTLDSPATPCPLGRPDIQNQDWDDWGYWTNLGWFDKFLQSKCQEQKGNYTLRQYWNTFLQRPVPPNDVLHFAQGSIFSVERSEIMSHPKSYYERLLQLVSNDVDPWAGYYNEWLWYYIFRHPEFNGQLCPIQDEGFARRRDVTPLALEMDCYYGCPDWDDWDTCALRDGACQQSRDCLDPNCARDTRACEPMQCFESCDVVEKCDEWSEWGDCDAECGEGLQERHCLSCIGVKTESVACQAPNPCPTATPTSSPTSAAPTSAAPSSAAPSSAAPSSAAPSSSSPSPAPTTMAPTSTAPTNQPTPCVPCNNYTCVGECGARVKSFLCVGENLCSFPVDEPCPWNSDPTFDGTWGWNDTVCSVSCGDRGVMKPRSCTSLCGGVTARALVGAVNESRCPVLDANVSCSPNPPACGGQPVELTLGFPTLDINSLPPTFAEDVVAAVASSLNLTEDNVEFLGAFAGSVNVKVAITTDSPAAETALRDQLASGGQQVFNAALQARGLPEAIVTAQPSPTQSVKSKDDGLSGGEIAGIVIGVVVGAVLLFGVAWCVFRKTKSSATVDPESAGILATDEQKHDTGSYATTA